MCSYIAIETAILQLTYCYTLCVYTHALVFLTGKSCDHNKAPVMDSNNEKALQSVFVTGFGKTCIVHTSDFDHLKIHKIW